MDHQIRISEETMARLKACARPFVDKEPEDVIRRLLAGLEKADRQGPPQPVAVTSVSLSRVPRERGATARIGGRQIQAGSVRDLYEQALKILVREHKAQIDALIPFRTSNERYLLSKKATHPSGRPFFVPVEYSGYFMEAHKDYKNAAAHLSSLLRRLGIPFSFVG